MMKTPPPTVWFMWFTSLAWCLPVVAVVVGTAITKDRGYHLAGSKAQQGQQGQQSHQLGHVEKEHLVQDINTTVTKKGHTPSADEKYVLITVGDVYPEPSNFRPEIVMYALQGAYATALKTPYRITWFEVDKETFEFDHVHSNNKVESVHVKHVDNNNNKKNQDNNGSFWNLLMLRRSRHNNNNSNNNPSMLTERIATYRSWYYYGFSCPACPKRDTDIVVAPELPSLTPDDILDQVAVMVCTSLRASGVPAFRDASMCTIQELDDA